MKDFNRALGVLGLTALTLIPFWSVRAGLPPPLPEDEEAAGRLLEIVGEAFRIRHTDHFTIAYDTPYEALRPLVGRLEGTHDAIWRFCELNGLDIQAPGARLEVLLFDRYEDFVSYGSRVGVSAESMAGFYHQQTNRAAFCNTLNSPDFRRVTDELEQARNRLQQLSRTRPGLRGARERRRGLQRSISSLQTLRDALVKRFNRFVIQHEAAHQMLFNIGVHVRGADNPPWLVEGLACQFEVPQSSFGADARRRARINHLRLADFREALKVPVGAKSIPESAYRDAFDSGRLVSLADLIADREILTKRGGNVVFRYAQAWALVYYLQREHRVQLAGYLRKLNTRAPGQVAGRRREIEDFQSAFGDPGEESQRAWVTYILKLPFSPP